MGSGEIGAGERRAVAAAIVLALLVAGAVTGAAAYVLRPSSRTSDTGAPPTVAAAVRIVATATATLTVSPTPAPPPSATPRRLQVPQPSATVSPSPRPTATPSPAATATPPPLYFAVRDDLAGWSGVGWSYADGILSNGGTDVANRPWLAAPFVPPDGPYAVEVSLKVRGLASGVCEQSFGVVAGGAGGIVWGGGVVFGCDGLVRARITDVTDPSNGYNRDRVLASVTFDPGDGWHRYRFEVAGNRLRLLIDDRLLLEASDDEATTDAAPGVVGLWSQGVRLDVRRVAVFPA